MVSHATQSLWDSGALGTLAFWSGVVLLSASVLLAGGVGARAARAATTVPRPGDPPFRPLPSALYLLLCVAAIAAGTWLMSLR